MKCLIIKCLIIISVLMLNSFVGAETNKDPKDYMVNWDETRGQRAIRWVREYKQWRKMIKTEDVDVDSYLVSKKAEDMVPYHCQCGRTVFFRQVLISYDVDSIFVWANFEQNYNANKIALQQCHNKYKYEHFALYDINCYAPGECPAGLPYGC